MVDTTNFRKERIEKLLHELQYEVERGIMEDDIDEVMRYGFYVPVSRTIKNGVIRCEFRMVPVPSHLVNYQP